MLTKFESKSNRVKGLSFHPTRPWILASLHNGAIQLWDYRVGTLIETFEGHDGPVRGVDFHPSQPLFASGGDDYKFKVWNYKLKRCIFTKQAHMDYIRTCKFHHEYPWVLTASDDQTIRIWNWQSREIISVLTGHTHYVMSASFHLKEDLVVSASLDFTVRVWDTSGLRKKTVNGIPGSDQPNIQPGAGGAAGIASRLNADWVTSNDAVVKYVLEGHEKGVNWASFHPNLPLIVSGADDRFVKLWRYNDSRAWEVENLRGHNSNVSCAIFHPKHELIVSNSEDKSIRVWDISKRMGVSTFAREHDRFWILAAHPQQNLLAAGHDTGLMVFKLERERPAYSSEKNKLFYCKDRYLRVFEYGKARDVPIVSMRRGGGGGGISSELMYGPKTMNYNPFNKVEQNVLVYSEMEGGTYELFAFAPDDRGETSEALSGHGAAAVFTSRNRFAVLDRSNNIIIKDMKNSTMKRLKSPFLGTDMMFPGGASGRVLLRCEDKTNIVLYETSSRRVLEKIVTPFVKYVSWNKDFSRVALIGKHTLTLADRNLQHVVSITETSKLKSGTWDDRGVFIYTTLSHIKYALANGDKGIIRTLDVPVYATRVQNNTLFCIDRETKVRTIALDCSEFLFKLCLMKKQYNQALEMIRSSRLCGQAIIGYLQKKGFPEVALHFVQDPKTRFDLALECGNIEVAMKSAYEVDEDECWHKLGVAALQQGNHQVVEMTYQKTRNLERLSFLYLITGNVDKLNKMLQISKLQGNTMSRFHNALYLGDVKERLAVLIEVGQIALAYLLAATHGLEEESISLAQQLADAGVPIPNVIDNNVLLMPPPPITRGENWPQLETIGSAFDNHDASDPENDIVDDNDEEGDGGNNWDIDGLDDELDGRDVKGREEQLPVEDGWGGDDLDLDLDLDDLELDAPSATNGGFIDMDELDDGSMGDVFMFPSEGTSSTIQWTQSSNLAADHAAAGNIESAMNLLHRQIGVVNFKPLKPFFNSAFNGSYCSLPGVNSFPSISISLPRLIDGVPNKYLPSSTTRLSHSVERLKKAYRCFQARKLEEAKTLFEWIMHAIPMTVVNSKNEENEVKELLGICREYLQATRLELARQASSDNPVRGAELAAYLSHCNLKPVHILNMLMVAMVSAFKIKNFINSASFATRILELPESGLEKNKSVRLKAKKVLQVSEKQGRNTETMNYDERKPFSICAASMVPVYMNQESYRCPYCSSVYQPQYKGSLCVTCDLSQVGVETLGLICFSGSKE